MNRTDMLQKNAFSTTFTVILPPPR